MKKVYTYPIIVLLIVFISGCTEQPKTITQKTPDKVEEHYHYLPNDYDTITDTLQLSMYNDPYTLFIRKYCLNDNAIYQNAVHNDSVHEVYIAHNYNTDLVLLKRGEEVLNRTISKSVFEDSLHFAFFENAVLKSIQYNGVRSNRLYFRAFLEDMSTHKEEEFYLDMYYQTAKKGEIHAWGTSWDTTTVED